MHGAIDMAIPAGSTVAYYRSLQSRYGAQLPSFVRFYMVPGFGHGDGAFRVLWDSLTALDNWVENGAPPGKSGGRRFIANWCRQSAASLRVPWLAAIQRLRRSQSGH